MPLKVYTPGTNVSVGRAILDLLGCDEQPQARVLVVASNRAVAARMCAKRRCGPGNPRYTTPAEGRAVDALDAAGLLTHPALYVLSYAYDSPVIEVDDDGNARIVGRLNAADESGNGLVFVPAVTS